MQKLKGSGFPLRGKDPQPICRALSIEPVIASKGQVGLFQPPCPNSGDRRHSASVKSDNAALAKADACQRDSLSLVFGSAQQSRPSRSRGKRRAVSARRFQVRPCPRLAAAGRTTLPFHPHGPVRPGPWVGLRPLPLCLRRKHAFSVEQVAEAQPIGGGEIGPLPSPHGGQHGTGQIRSLSGRDRQDHCRP